MPSLKRRLPLPTFSHIRQFPLESLKERRERGETETRPDAAAHADFWATAKVTMPPPGTASVHLRVDADVLEWFRS